MYIPESRLNGNLKSFFKDLTGSVAHDKEIKTNAIVITIKTLTGEKPIIDRSNSNVNVIKFTPNQRKKLESLFSKKPTKETGEPSNVRIDHKTLWFPFVLKKGVPIMLGVGFLCYMAGRARIF